MIIARENFYGFDNAQTSYYNNVDNLIEELEKDYSYYSMNTVKEIYQNEEEILTIKRIFFL